MIYVYDIILNWTDSDRVYEFFEWEINDDLEHIKKIPLFKVDSTKFSELLDYEFKINNEFLEKIENLTEIYGISTIEKIKYSTLFTDGVRVMAIEFDAEGKVIYRSRLLLDEEEEVMILSNKLNYYELNIEKLRKRDFYEFSTRQEIKIKKVLEKEITDSYEKKNLEKLKYLYLECFDVESEDIDEIYNKLLTSIKKEENYTHNKLYEVVKLSYHNKC